MTTTNDRETLRRLAGRVREIAELPEQKLRRQRWYDHNALKPQRPLILCFPEGAWTELVPESTLECTDKVLRGWELGLRRTIYHWDYLRDDHTVEPWFNVPWHVDNGDYGVNIAYTRGADRGSYKWEAPVKDIARDLPGLHFRRPSVNRQATAAHVELAGELFGDLLPPRIRGTYWWTAGLTWQAIRLIGLEELMLYMCDQPQNVHRLMAWLRDEQLNFMRWFEREGLLSPVNEAEYTGSGGVAYTHELPQADRTPGAPVRLKDVWGFAEAQETVGIAPRMFGEFVFPYQLPLLAEFGLNCYGCCEAVDKRLDYLLTIPRLRRVSVSPWANQETMAAQLGRRVIFSRKPNPALVCVSFDEARIRADLSGTLAVAGGGVLEIIMKDTHTVQQQPWRLHRWVQMALEEVDRYVSGENRK